MRQDVGALYINGLTLGEVGERAGCRMLSTVAGASWADLYVVVYQLMK